MSVVAENASTDVNRRLEAVDVHCKRYSSRRGFCGRFLGRFAHGVGWVKCPACGNRQAIDVPARGKDEAPVL